MSTEVISNRRRQLSEFRDLFSALFKIPDREVQNRVLRAVNGLVNETCDCECCKKITKDVGTQTEFVTNSYKIFAKDNYEKLEKMGIKDNQNNSEISQTFYGENDKFVINENSLDSLRDREFKPRRKRTKKIPRVEKAKDSVNLITLSNGQKRPSPSSQDSHTSAKKDKILKSEGNSDFSDIEDLNSAFPFEPAKTDIMDQMKKEWKICLEFKDGLLPIHSAIVSNNLNQLKRQMFVMDFKSINVHRLLSSDGQSPLQIAIKMNSTPDIIIHLLEKGADIQETDENGNTIIHLAILYLKQTKTFLAILKEYKTDLRLLSVTNNDGQSPLHVGIINNKFEMCKVFLEFVDNVTNCKHNVKPIGNQNIKDAYLHALDGFGIKDAIEINEQKMKLVNQKDTKHGRTALFFALEQKSSLLTMMLLCHLADPKITDYAGIDCHIYAGDHFENAEILLALLNTSLYIDKCQDAMKAKRFF